MLLHSCLNHFCRHLLMVPEHSLMLSDIICYVMRVYTWCEQLLCWALAAQFSDRVSTYTHIQTHMHIHTHTYIHTYIHTYTHTNSHAQTHMHIHTHTYTHTHTYKHTHTHTHTLHYSGVHHSYDIVELVQLVQSPPTEPHPVYMLPLKLFEVMFYWYNKRKRRHHLMSLYVIDSKCCLSRWY